MNCNITISGGTLDGIVDAVGEILSYCRTKALYEADCRVREEMARAREALFQAKSRKCMVVTVELARSKARLSRLKRMVAEAPESVRSLLDGLVIDLEDHIAALREERASSGNRGCKA